MVSSRGKSNTRQYHEINVILCLRAEVWILARQSPKTFNTQSDKTFTRHSSTCKKQKSKHQTYKQYLQTFHQTFQYMQEAEKQASNIQTVFTNIAARARAQTHIHALVRTQVHTKANTHTYTHTHTHTTHVRYTHTHRHTHTHKPTHACARTYTHKHITCRYWQRAKYSLGKKQPQTFLIQSAEISQSLIGEGCRINLLGQRN